MSKLLVVQASPRGGRSRSRAVADAFVEAYRSHNPGDEVTVVDLFERRLPEFDGAALEAKYALLGGGSFTEEQARAWGAVRQVIDEFKEHDKFVFAVPMWNFGVPYRLKHYIDLLLQPGHTFSYTPEEGYRGLVTGKPAFVAYARGGRYDEGSPLDHQKSYLELLLGFIGFERIESVVVEPTLMGGPEAAERALAEAVEAAKQVAGRFS